MPAARSIIGQCPTCCPRIEHTYVVGINGQATAYGWPGFDDGSYNPSNPTAWNGYAKVYGRVDVSASRVALGNNCTTCSGESGIGSHQTDDWSGYSEIDDPFNVHHVRYMGTYDNPCVLSSSPSIDEMTDWHSPHAGTSVSDTYTLTKRTIDYTHEDCSFPTFSQMTGGGEVEKSSLVAPAVPSIGTGGIYTCSEVDVTSVNTLPTNTYGTITCNVKAAKIRLNVYGKPSFNYEITLNYVDTKLVGGAFVANHSEVVDVTTDADGQAEWEQYIPRPVADPGFAIKRCLASKIIAEA